MKKSGYYLLVVLLFAITFIGCTADTPEIVEEPPAETAEEVAEPAVDDTDAILADDSLLEDHLNKEIDSGNIETALSRILTSAEMRAFEAEHAVSEAQERYLAFGAFVLTNNRESIRVFALDGSHSAAGRILADFWNVEDRESALRQLTYLVNADGQSPIADDIFNTLVKNGRLEPLDAIEMFLYGFDITGLERVYSSALNRAERMTEEFEFFVEILGALEEEREEAFELFVLLQFTDRINRGLEAYLGARDLLIDEFGFTEEELLSIETLAAWDYGRAAIIARYGVAAGYLAEDEAWEYLKLAADSAAELYSCWREYTAAHILGRALAFGNPSHDFILTLNFLLNHSESPFQHIEFHGL